MTVIICGSGWRERLWLLSGVALIPGTREGRKVGNVDLRVGASYADRLFVKPVCVAGERRMTLKRVLGEGRGW